MSTEGCSASFHDQGHDFKKAKYFLRLTSDSYGEHPRNGEICCNAEKLSLSKEGWSRRP